MPPSEVIGLWSEVGLLKGRYGQQSGARRWRCRYCGVERASSLMRLKAHLLRITRLDGTRLGATPCSSIPPTVRQRLLAQYGEGIARQGHVYEGIPESQIASATAHAQQRMPSPSH
ncbi:hypothetical protein O6H91_05G031500 [Diphasiastrum complanatum]|uniref:Uncharacterized protein n=1 Tax=Diphasiastrum complanatum TaxID=34168 RepID=A0ACC2DM29_DIPCM|nr:hypothetical protein O6H91_05G031500 [Diphasiastrum complanatum]